LKSSFNFYIDIISGIINATLASTILQRQPLAANKSKEYITRRYSIPDSQREIDSRLNGIHIHKNLRLAKAIRESIIESSGLRGSFFTTIADKDATSEPLTHSCLHFST
jgi:hypothetical protein